MQPSRSFKYHEPHQLLSQSLLNEHQIINHHHIHSPSTNTHTPDEENLHPNNNHRTHINNHTHNNHHTDNKFYQEYKKIYTVSYHLYLEKLRQIQLCEKISNEIKQIEQRFKCCKQKVFKKGQSEENRIKRSRRTSQMIEKKYRCSVAYCQRLYGTQGSLQQHIKLKHPELYNQEYDFIEMQMDNADNSYESSSI